MRITTIIIVYIVYIDTQTKSSYLLLIIESIDWLADSSDNCVAILVYWPIETVASDNLSLYAVCHQ